MLTHTEENYIKAIYTIQHASPNQEASVNEIADRMKTKPATVTDMLRKLSEKELINYRKYRKLNLTDAGKTIALQIIRKHRLWETFLHEKLNFSWDEVHEVAEQLEHIHSKKLIDGLDAMLGYPEFDPHGDPIPNAQGVIPPSNAIYLSDAEQGKKYVITGVKNTHTLFLQQLEKMQLQIGTLLHISGKMPFDNSLMIHIDKSKANPLMLSEKIATNLLVVPAS